MLSTNEIRKLFLRKLLRAHCIGGKYMPEVYLFKRKSDWTKAEQKLAEDIWEDLIKSTTVLLKPGKNDRLVRLINVCNYKIMTKLMIWNSIKK